MTARSCRALYGRFSANLYSESGNYYRSPVLLTDAQSQGTKVASTVARGGKDRKFQGNFIKPVKSCENPGSPGKPFLDLFPPV